MSLKRPEHLRPATASLEARYRARAQAYSLDVADDGYVIAAGDPPQDQRLDVQQACSSGKWVVCPATDCLGECMDAGCSCSRTVNPTARDGFSRYVAQRIAEVSAGQREVAYASFGCGLLRFDFFFLEALLAAGVPVTAVHLVDSQYEPGGETHERHRAALAQFAAWFADRSVEVYAHPSLEQFAFRVRQAQVLPVAVLQVDCTELTGVFDRDVKPMLEEVLAYGGLFCALTARAGAAPGGLRNGTSDAWGEIWRLVPERGRLDLLSRLRFRPEEPEGRLLGEDEPLPPPG